jgi:hypothetical protein
MERADFRLKYPDNLDYRDVLNTNLCTSHFTELKYAKSIITDRYIFGRDVCNPANFYLLGAENSQHMSGEVFMVFKWFGKQKLANPITTNNNSLPDILYHVGCENRDLDNHELGGHWKSHIFPPTKKGLFLVSIGLRGCNGPLYCLSNPIEIKVDTMGHCN